MKRMTYNNLMKAIKLLQAKGYDWNESEILARQRFDAVKYNNYAMTVESLIEKTLTKAEYDQAYGM